MENNFWSYQIKLINKKVKGILKEFSLRILSAVFPFWTLYVLEEQRWTVICGGLENSMSILLKFLLSKEQRTKLHNPNIYFNLVSNRIIFIDFLLLTYL